MRLNAAVMLADVARVGGGLPAVGSGVRDHHSAALFAKLNGALSRCPNSFDWRADGH